MANQRALNIINIFSIICGAWFILGGWVWVYLFNVIFVFPIALLGFGLWLYGRRAANIKLNRVAGWLLLIGLILSFGFLMAWYISGGA